MRNFPALHRKHPEQTGALLSNIRIASPCPADWNTMVGDDRVRHCSECNLNVYNFSAMTEAEAMELLKNRDGQRLCGRFYRRADGTILTKDCPWSLRVIARQASRRVATMLTLVLSASLGFAKGRPKEKASCECQTIQQKESGIKMTVMDQQGAVIPNAEIVLDRKSPRETIKGVTDATGEWSQVKLPSGQYSVTVKFRAFRTFQSTIEVHNGELLKLKLKMAVAEVNTAVEVRSAGIVVTGGITSYTESSRIPPTNLGGQHSPMRP